MRSRDLGRTCTHCTPPHPGYACGWSARRRCNRLGRPSYWRAAAIHHHVRVDMNSHPSSAVRHIHQNRIRRMTSIRRWRNRAVRTPSFVPEIPHSVRRRCWRWANFRYNFYRSPFNSRRR